MVRQADNLTKVHCQGKNEDFIIFVDSPEAVKKWKTDPKMALTDVVSAFEIFVNDKHGAQGELGSASKAVLENEFGTSKDEEVIRAILDRGNVQASQLPERQGATNDSKGGSTFGTGNKPF